MLDMNEMCQRLAMHEGIRLSPYRCSKGKLTIGIGRNVEDNPVTDEEQQVVGDWRHGITKQAAFYLLRNDIRRVWAELKQKVPFWQELSDERKYALLDMAFNLGINGLLAFKKMLAAMGTGNFNQAAIECLDSRYAKDVGKRAERIAETIRTGRFRV